MNAPLTHKDFTTSQEVRWCPGCGDYAILRAVTKTLAEIGATRENTAFVSGIGCSSRFPYYVESYGFHTIHGRAPAVATGLKLTNPELDVWVVTGDGDGLSIGGNHLLHALRRNVDLNILLFNNEIYGLTKGQYSPTSRVGTRTPSSPGGSTDTPLIPGQFAIGAGSKFYARAIDTDKVGLSEVLTASHAHKGASMIEIFQNCIVYNDNVFGGFTDKENVKDSQLKLAHGEPMVYGAEQDKGLAFDIKTMALKVVDPAKHADEILVHDETNKVIAQLLLGMPRPQFPVALGVIFRQEDDSFDKTYYNNHVSGMKRTGTIKDVLRKTTTWKVD
jgi:2-oxoglutarate/2-oxoacid ferredoxin oxidoreductase subunit beta